jgi:hypothetical protein
MPRSEFKPAGHESQEVHAENSCLTNNISKTNKEHKLIY